MCEHPLITPTPPARWCSSSSSPSATGRRQSLPLLLLLLLLLASACSGLKVTARSSASGGSGGREPPSLGSSVDLECAYDHQEGDLGGRGGVGDEQLYSLKWMHAGREFFRLSRGLVSVSSSSRASSSWDKLQPQLFPVPGLTVLSHPPEQPRVLRVRLDSEAASGTYVCEVTLVSLDTASASLVLGPLSSSSSPSPSPHLSVVVITVLLLLVVYGNL